MKHHMVFSSHTHIALIKVYKCARARLCSVLSGRGFQGVLLFVFQADLSPLGRTITLTSLPWKVCSLSDSAQVTSGTTQNRRGGEGSPLWTSKQAVKFARRYPTVYMHDIVFQAIYEYFNCLQNLEHPSAVNILVDVDYFSQRACLCHNLPDWVFFFT